MKKSAIIIGATGLVGQKLLQLADSVYDDIIVISRRHPIEISSRMQVHLLEDFSHLSSLIETIPIAKHTDAFSCLGTTRKQAGSKVKFRTVDYDYNLIFAQSCHHQGVGRFFLLSALGADANSHFFYNQVKGELEQAIAMLKFDRFYCFRPSLLLGKHDNRPLEHIAQQAFKVVAPLLSEKIKLHPIDAARVAKAMMVVAQHSLQDDEKRVNSSQSRGGDTESNIIVIDNKQMLAMTRKNQ